MYTTKRLNVSRPAIYPILTLAESMSIVAATTILAATTFLAGCRSSAPAAPATIIDNYADGRQGNDPSDANLAPVSSQANYSSAPAARVATGKVRALGAQQSYTPQQSSEQDPQQPYPQQQAAPPEGQYSDQGQNAYPNGYDTGVAAGYEALADASQPPPPLPQYDQPPVPEPNDLWTPGYWNYAPQGYYWVPGAWVAPPYAGALWTPAYWGYDGGRYRLHRGFWARHVGFYGGINYGFGYTGSGYRGGYWNGNDFYYNRAVNHVNITTIHNVYERNVTVNNITRVSYNGGNGGIQARPGTQELAVLREQRTPPMATQVQLREASARNPQQFFKDNHGRPAEPFAARPVAAEHGIQPPPAQPVQMQRPQAADRAFTQQRMNEEQHAAAQNQNRLQSEAQQPHAGQEARPGQTFHAGQDQTHLNASNPHQEPPASPQPQRAQPSVQQQAQQQNAAQQRFQEQQQASQQQRLQQEHMAQQQQAEQQRSQQQQQQQRASQQAEQQKNVQQRSSQPAPRQEVQPRPEVQPGPAAQPRPAPQGRPEAQGRPQPTQAQQQPRPQPQAAQPHPQAQPHAEGPRGEQPHH